MCPHKPARTFRYLPVLVLSVFVAGQSKPAQQADAPRIHPVDQRFLTQLIRRTFEQNAAGSGTYKPAYVPPTLQHIDCQVVVTLREGGYPRYVGVSGVTNIVDACQQAALRTQVKALSEPGFLDRVHIDVQVLGPVVPYTSAVDWTQPHALAGFLEPGLDGVQLFLDGDQRWFTPAEMIANNVSFAEAMRTLGKEVSLDPQVLNEAKLARFRTCHWWEVDDEGRTVELTRGMIKVPIETVTAVGLDHAIHSLGDYLVYRQRPDATFGEVFDPAADRYVDENLDLLVQCGAAWAAAAYADYSEKSDAARTATRALDAQLDNLLDLPDVADASFVLEPKMRNRLGTTAQLCLGLTAMPGKDRYTDAGNRLANAMLWTQQSSGRFMTAFPPADVIDTQERFPGQALLALARCYQRSPSEKILHAFDRALVPYRDLFRHQHPAELVPWHAQAFAIMARQTKRSDYCDFAYELTDFAIGHQLSPQNSHDEQLWGAITDGNVLAPGASTALFLESFAESARLAQSRDDTAKRQRYEEAVRLAARFVMQLQFKPQECFFVRSLADTVGGIRNSPTDVAIRIDSCQHALIGLIEARQLLFPETR